MTPSLYLLIIPKKIPHNRTNEACVLVCYHPTGGRQAGPEVINSDISSLIVAEGVWLHSAPPLLGLCSISTPQVSNFDSLTTLISILESFMADIQFLCGENKGCWCSCAAAVEEDGDYRVSVQYKVQPPQGKM